MSQNKSYAEIINAAKVMLSGLKANTERVGKRGLDSAFVDKFEMSMGKAQALDNEQESLKATLKTKTADLEKEVDELNKLLAESKKVVKLEMAKESWKAFGIQDSK